MSEDLSDTTMPGADVSAPEPAEDAAPLATEELSVSEPENALPKVGLADLPEAMRAACARAGWQSLMPVQSLALPYLLEGRDIMVQSRTGSGKTGCYLLPCCPAWIRNSRPRRPWCSLPRVSWPCRWNARPP